MIALDANRLSKVLDGGLPQGSSNGRDAPAARGHGFGLSGAQQRAVELRAMAVTEQL